MNQNSEKAVFSIVANEKSAEVPWNGASGHPWGSESLTKTEDSDSKIFKAEIVARMRHPKLLRKMANVHKLTRS